MTPFDSTLSPELTAKARTYQINTRKTLDVISREELILSLIEAMDLIDRVKGHMAAMETDLEEKVDELEKRLDTAGSDLTYYRDEAARLESELLDAQDKLDDLAGQSQITPLSGRE